MHLLKDKGFSKAGWPSKDWGVSHTMLDLTVATILQDITLNREYDVPYLAGYSKNGKIIYIDRHMPKSFVYRGRRIKTDKYLILHESIEKALIDKYRMPYQYAHQVALRSEEAAVRADKIAWRAYDNFMQKYIKTIGDERLTKIPKNLDTKPYRDEDDSALLKKMLKVMR